MDAEEAVLAWLDFTYEPPCTSAAKCPEEGWAIITLADHDSCTFNAPAFYVTCAKHWHHWRKDGTHCPKCGEPIPIKNVLEL